MNAMNASPLNLSSALLLSLFFLLLLLSPAAGAVDTWVKLTPSAVSASAFDTGGEPEKAIDGDLGTWWAGHGVGQYLTLDYGSSKPIRQVQIGFYQGTVRVYSFEIMYSTDGATFISAGRFDSSGTTTALETFAVSFSARYLRVVGLANTINEYNSYTEVRGFAVASVGGTIQIDDGFEGPTLGALWKSSGNNTVVPVTGVARAGSQSAHVTLGPTDSDPLRTEIVRTDTSGYFTVGNTYCLSFSVMRDHWTATPPVTVFLQTHGAPNSWTTGYAAGRNSISMTLESTGVMAIRVVTTQRTGPASGAALGDLVASIPAPLGTWHDWVFRFRPSKTTDGIIEVWADGTKLYTQLNAPNMDLLDSGGFPVQNYEYLKLGVYKTVRNTGSQEAYFDNVKLARNPTTCSGQ